MTRPFSASVLKALTINGTNSLCEKGGWPVQSVTSHFSNDRLIVEFSELLEYLKWKKSIEGERGGLFLRPTCVYRKEVAEKIEQSSKSHSGRDNL